MRNKDGKLILIGLFLVYLIFEIALWLKTSGMPAMMEQGETYLTYLAGKNFVRYGIVKQRFIEDYAMGCSEASHPYYFTHNPDFPVFVSYFLQKIGITSLPAQTFITIFILGLGLFYMFLSVKEYTGNTAAGVFVLGVSVFTYPGVLVYGLHILRSWIWIILFGNLYHLKKYAEVNKQKDFILGILFFSLIAYYDYILTIFAAVIILLFKLFRFYAKLSFKRLIVYGILGCVPAFIVHKTFLIWALGWDTFVKDIYFTFAKRISGNPGIMAQMKEFYISKGIVLWEAPQVEINLTYLKSLLDSAIERLGIIFGSSCLKITAVFFVFCVLRFVLANRLSEKKQAAFFVVFALSTIFICCVFPLYVNAIFVGPLAPFFVFAITIGEGIFFSVLFTNLLHSIKNNSRVIMVISAIMLVFSVSYYLRINYIHLTKTIPVQAMPAHNLLVKYKGCSFVTNYQASYVNYFTDQWAKMVWWDIGALNIEEAWQRDLINAHISSEFIRRNEYIFERDRLINNVHYEAPDFLFITNMWAYPYFANPQQTFRKYPLVEKGDNFWIFDLRVDNQAAD